MSGPSSLVVRPLYVHSREIKQTNEQCHPKLNSSDDIVTRRRGASLNIVASGHRYFLLGTRGKGGFFFFIRQRLFGWYRNGIWNFDSSIQLIFSQANLFLWDISQYYAFIKIHTCISQAISNLETLETTSYTWHMLNQLIYYMKTVRLWKMTAFGRKMCRSFDVEARLNNI